MPAADLCCRVIDSLDFAREGRVLEGWVPVSALERLADVIVDSSGVLRCRLHGMGEIPRQNGRLGLALEVLGSVRLRCERCLQPMDVSLQVENRLLLVAPGESWPDEEELEEDAQDEAWDVIDASREQSVLALIEEEVLLALPIVPKHDDCTLPVAVVDKQEPSPFAVLAKLKQ